MTQAQYPIATTVDEFTRLEIQADLFREDARAMLARIGDGAGRRVLDLCCGIGGITDVLSAWVGATGHVIGADLDVAKLERARAWARQQQLTNVEFIEANAFDSGLPLQSFDLVHSRFAISVIENGLGILDHMLQLVRPDGWVFVEEANTHTMQCVPTTRDWEHALALMKRTFQIVGADTELGPSLRGAFLDRGLAPLAVKPCLHALTAQDPMTLHLPMTLASMTETITSHGLMEAGELEALVARLADHLAKPETMTISYSMIQVVGRAPK
ncbi:MAG: class I SAM-dependent methyltransferase [Hyphomicrobiaceae bacterium]